MPLRSKVITTLPVHIREEIDRRLLENGFRDYEGLAEWVRSQGHEISDDSLWRYGRNLQQNVIATKLTIRHACELAEIASGDEALIDQALLTVARRKALETLLDLEQVKPAELNAVANLMRAVRAQQQWTLELKARTEQQNRAVKERDAWPPASRPAPDGALHTLAILQKLRAAAAPTTKPVQADPQTTANNNDETPPAAEPLKQRTCIAAEKGSSATSDKMAPPPIASAPHQASPRIAADLFVQPNPVNSRAVLDSLSDIASIVAPPHLRAFRSEKGTPPKAAT
jgi:hypothetical protein